jgi:hypothetical protein
MIQTELSRALIQRDHICSETTNFVNGTTNFVMGIQILLMRGLQNLNVIQIQKLSKQ